MSIEMFKTGFLAAEIEVVSVDKKTEKSVWIKGRRQAKVGEYESFFDSYSDAKEYLVGKYSNNIQRLAGIVQIEQDNLEAAKAL